MEPSYSSCDHDIPGWRWVSSCSSDHIPHGALLVGNEGNGDKIYAGRANHEGDVLPAKIIPATHSCYVTYSGKEIRKDHYEVLVHKKFSWRSARNGDVPQEAVPAGVTADAETLYYGRVTHDGHTTPGKIQPSHGCCYYPWNNDERKSREYECLVFV